MDVLVRNRGRGGEGRGSDTEVSDKVILIKNKHDQSFFVIGVNQRGV